MDMRRERIVDWVAGRIMPHEREARARLRQLGCRPQEIDDIVQDAYLQISQLPAVDHIRDGRSYLLATARAVLLRRLRRERVVRIDQLSDSVELTMIDDAPDPERRAQGRQELERVVRLIAALPPRCRQVFELRRIDGMSQRDIAARLGISEGMVEQEAIRGLRLLNRALVAADGDARPASPRRGLFRRRAERGSAC